MYWGDASLDKIETAYLNGTGRRTLLSETNTHYYAFVLHDGNLYFTDWRNEYAKYCDEYVCLCVCLSARISPEPRARSVRNFFGVLTMSMVRPCSGMLTIGRIAYRREGVTAVTSAGEV